MKSQMSSNIDPRTINIFINGHKKEVYNNQSILQALLQIDENIQHCCHAARKYQIDSRNIVCAVKIENHERHRDFKACLAPVVAGMRILTR